jgi:hypothetical protein
MSGGAWCGNSHSRIGLVTNQNPSEPYNAKRAHASVATCNRDECIAKGIKYVAGTTNETATYYDDEERWRMEGRR